MSEISASISTEGIVGYLDRTASIEGDVSMHYTHETKYDGPYIVVPSQFSQELDTKDKMMTDDVSITAIPYFRTSNPSGGDTVYIGDLTI